MRTETKGKHHLMVFDTFGEFVRYNVDNGDKHEDYTESFNGVSSLREAIDMATKGLPTFGIEGLNLAQERIERISADLVDQHFKPVYDVAGASVDVGRFLSGEPECMVDYFMEDTMRTERIVTVATGLCVSASISKETIKQRGYKLMALCEAIDRTGLQSEMWADYSIEQSSSGYSLRIAVRLKAPGEMFDPGMFMYALSHPSSLRALAFNAWNIGSPGGWRRPLSIGHGYGTPMNTAKKMDDYPPSTVYVPGVKAYGDWKDFAFQPENVLKELGLLA